MKSSIWFALVGSTLLSTSGCNLAPSSRVELAVITIPASVELGRIAQGAKKEALVHLVNQGNTTLRISSISTSCGCTSSQVDNKILQPGQPVALRVNYDSSGFSGHEEKLVSINFADGQPTLRVPVRADIYYLLKVTLPAAGFGAIRLGANKTRTVVLERVDGGALPLPRFKSTPELQISATRRDSKRIALQLRMQPRGFAGTRQSSLPIQTGLKALPQISLATSASVSGHYLTTPREMNFGAVRGATTRRVVISGVGSQTLGKLQIAKIPAGFSAALSKSDNGVVLTLKSDGKAPNAIINDAVWLQTGDAREAQLKIPVLAVLQAV